MNAFLKSCALTTVVSLALATSATAETTVEKRTVSAIAPAQPTLVAQFRTEISPRFMSIRLMDQMIMKTMEMVAMAQEMSQSSNPEIKKMAEQMIVAGNADIARLVDMRRKMFLENADRG